ncbi:SNF2 family N-terminal domain-containing protein [Pelagophyceae sp. CCMP2097]|nr:SNF2 family N-terminal domain-containing protein [Pelagophyceae sp. CCMP2097]|mmetsp:Transcript_17718/g.59771  ORF Transcript_17718/g.59771 Transcript_17718/m.59771 type:complete len:722 (-) Transcript_17718:227-2392(-)
MSAPEAQPVDDDELEEARVAALLDAEDQNADPSADAAVAPTLLRAAAASQQGDQAALLIDRNASEDAKKQQLDTLLAKAEQYSQFIVNSQLGEQKAADEAPGGKRKGDESEEGRAKRAKVEGMIGEATGKQAKAKTSLVQQPVAMVGGELKGYQVEGLRWLATLYENGLSGILADEMGLGKTIQVIALVAHIREKSVKGPIIIAAPLATLPNWIKEFRKWTPSIRVVLYHGSKEDRKKMRADSLQVRHSQEENFPVIITSFEMCIVDRAALAHFHFKYLVIDEGQRVKNRDCRLVRELKKLNSENRLLLSGTPIQNTLEELWSLLNFVNPQIFDDLRVFQSWFGFRNIGQETQVDDILGEQQKDRIVTKLHEILRPFLLRRVKSDVLAGLLPPKQEIVVYAAMTPLQRTYEELLLQNRLRSELEKHGVQMTAKDVSEMNLLMNQRKNANHPFLFGEPTDANGEFVGVANPLSLVNASGKFRLLERMLPRLKAGKHKVLLFSQMTELLNILEDYLRGKGWKYFRIDGSVKLAERQRQIDEFNAEPKGENDLFIFMLSTRAGGLGINLASADTCILFDSDWNPHQDSQAMDRCHRIGQTRPVLVFRFLTSGSVEIAMMEKQIAKKKLERMAVTGGDYNKAGRRSRGDLTVDSLRALLTDDVNISLRLAAQDSAADASDLTDAELDLILDRQKIFSKEGIPLEGAMYDVVAASNVKGLIDQVSS